VPGGWRGGHGQAGPPRQQVRSRQTLTATVEMWAKREAARRRARAPDDDPARTRGRRVTLGGKSVQLPPDAYIEGHARGLVQAPNGSIGEKGAIIVHRGKARASVDDRTGKVVRVTEDPAQAGLMDFLVEALGR